MGNINSQLGPSGELTLKVMRGGLWPQWPTADSVRSIVRHSFPQKELSTEVNAYRKRNLPNIWRGLKRVAIAEKCGIATQWGNLWATVYRGNGEIVELGLISTRVVTTAGVNFIVDAFQNTTELETMKYHGFGEGATAEAVGDTALVTELTTEYATASTRPTGTTVEGGTANVYRSVATLSPSADCGITEHGIFSATTAGTLLDRSLFAVVNLIGSSDSLQVTYDLTFTAGS